MKLGILLLVVGVTLLLMSILFSIWGIVTAINQLEEEVISGGIIAWLGIIGVVAGFVMTTIGAVRVFKR